MSEFISLPREHEADCTCEDEMRCELCGAVADFTHRGYLTWYDGTFDGPIDFNTRPTPAFLCSACYAKEPQ